MEAVRSKAFVELMRTRKSFPAGGEVRILNGDPFYASPFRIAEVSAAALAARGLAANDLWEIKTGRRQKISVDARAAAACSMYGAGLTRLQNERGEYEPIPESSEVSHIWAATQPFPTKDGRWALPHFNLPHLRNRVLNLLGADYTVDSIRAGVAKWEADGLEDAIASAGACGAKIRSQEEWLAHPQGAYLAARPVVEVTKIADGAPEPLPPGIQPASGIRVLDLTRMAAGPTAALGLAEHGADVLMVTGPQLPQMPAYVRDLSHGKRSCFIDITREDELARLTQLVKESDIFIQGYRPERLDARGLGVDALTKLRPGLIYVTVNCFGSGGPFANRAGWDQIAQSVTGLAHATGMAWRRTAPQLTPVFICDYLAGYLGAYGALVALSRRAREGGSYKVEVSLCQAAMFLLRHGQVDGFETASGKLSETEFERFAFRVDDTPYGNLMSFGPVVEMSETPCSWRGTLPSLGLDSASWLPR